MKQMIDKATGSVLPVLLLMILILLLILVWRTALPKRSGA
jgi:hypothetical protein